MSCPFCRRLAAGDLLAESASAAAFADAFPLTPGHTLIVPRRHEPDLFALDAAEQDALWQLLRVVQRHVQRTHGPDGYNVGVNVGAPAGQTVGHVHVHLIPRYLADVDDPRGGIRWIIPARARYWES
jgi:diadenosine tetraphosphate (Ap4A) HIT family hydrolase